jgi:hypothetical protein
MLLRRRGDWLSCSLAAPPSWLRATRFSRLLSVSACNVCLPIMTISIAERVQATDRGRWLLNQVNSTPEL